MKKSPHKLPFELHDPKPAPRNCAGPLDLSDAVLPRPEMAMPRPTEPELPGAKF